MTSCGSADVRARTAALGAVLLAACAGAGQPASAPEASASSTAVASATVAPVQAVSSEYGKLTLKTAPRASCNVLIRVSAPSVGEAPPPAASGIADESGMLTVTYATPRITATAGTHDVTCLAGELSSSVSTRFLLAFRPLSAMGLMVKIRADDGTLDGAAIKTEPSLVPVRDAMLAKLRATLTAEWKLGTRGLSAVSLVESSEDLLMTVVAARGTSVHRRGPDGSEDVVVYAADDHGAISADNGVAVAMHELGHIWCCYGAGTTDGHWSVAQKSPELSGVDAYGLMNHPVQCVIFPTSRIESCPNRFSERELRAMGFSEIPPPPPDACLGQKGALSARLADQDSQLASLQQQIDATNGQITDLGTRIKTIEGQYPNGIPQSVYPTYTAMVDQYNGLVRTNRDRVAAYNQLVATRNDTARAINALLC